MAQSLVASGANSRQIARALERSFGDLSIATRQRLTNEAVSTFQAKQNIAAFLASGGSVTQFTNVAQLLGCPPGTKQVAMVIGANREGDAKSPIKQFYGEVVVDITGAGRNTLMGVFSPAYASVLQQMRDKNYTPSFTPIAGQTSPVAALNITNIRCL